MLVAAMMILAGVWMRWHSPRQRMSLEEAAKDERITSEAARVRFGRYQTTSTVCIVSGVALMLGVLLWSAH
jgi:hypothetical protein